MSNEMRGVLIPGKRRDYVLAGKSTFTVTNPKTDGRFTYHVVESDPRPGQMPVWFVSVLNGPDNSNDYLYIGTIFADGFRLTRKSRATDSALSVVVFKFFASRWEDSRLEVYHEGVCGKCGRKLTVPESIASGLGPVCAGRD